jgi:hypothetical protein
MDSASKAKDRLAKLERGEAVEGGLGRSSITDVDSILKSIGWTAADIKHSQVMDELGRYGLADEFIEEQVARLHPKNTEVDTRRRARRLLQAVKLLTQDAEAARGSLNLAEVLQEPERMLSRRNRL